MICSNPECKREFLPKRSDSNHCSLYCIKRNKFLKRKDYYTAYLKKYRKDKYEERKEFNSLRMKKHYLENKGYLWIIWDYGLTSPLYDSNKYVDYYRILNAFISYEDYGWNNKLKYKINRAINIFDNIPEYKNNKNFENKLFNELFSYHTPIYVKPPDSQIINLNKPYIL